MKVRVLGLAGVLLVAACGGTGATNAPASRGHDKHGPGDNARAGPRTHRHRRDSGGRGRAQGARLVAVHADDDRVGHAELLTHRHGHAATYADRRDQPHGESIGQTRPALHPHRQRRLVRHGHRLVHHIQGIATTHVNAQFQPYYLDGLVASAEVSGYQYLPVGPETISGVPTTHYRLVESIVQSIIANMPGITTTDWAADVWIAKADGSLAAPGLGSRSRWTRLNCRPASTTW